jgi:hypothetical protein
MRWRDAAASVALALIAAGCASGDQAGGDASATHSPRLSRPMRYRLAGEDVKLRRYLDHAETELKASDYSGAVASVNKALWSLEGIDKRTLRLTELADAYDALARANAGLGNADMADEQRRTARALLDAIGQEPPVNPAARVAQGKKAYRAAQFGEAIRLLRQAVVDLEEVPFEEVRIIHLVEARCYLAFSYYAADDHARMRDELTRVWAQDPALTVCRRDAPPAVRSVIFEIQRRMDS